VSCVDAEQIDYGGRGAEQGGPGSISQLFRPQQLMLAAGGSPTHAGDESQMQAQISKPDAIYASQEQLHAAERYGARAGAHDARTRPADEPGTTLAQNG